MRRSVSRIALVCRGRAAFSLVEVTLAVGLISFVLVALLGLLPAGLNVQRNAVLEARSTQVLSDLAQAVRGVRLDGAVHRFPATLAEVAVGGGSTTLPVGVDGLVDNPADRRGSVVIEQLAAPAGNPDLLPVRISVAWPAAATWVASGGGKWNKADGHVETFVYAEIPR